MHHLLVAVLLLPVLVSRIFRFRRKYSHLKRVSVRNRDEHLSRDFRP